MTPITKIISQNPLFFACLFPALMDATLTLFGQNQDYWTKRIAIEASPAYYFLAFSPYLFILGSMFWFVMCYMIFKRLKEPTNLFLMFVFISAHSWGSTTWIWKIAKNNQWYLQTNQSSVISIWLMVICYFILIAWLASSCLKIYLTRKSNS